MYNESRVVGVKQVQSFAALKSQVILPSLLGQNIPNKLSIVCQWWKFNGK